MTHLVSTQAWTKEMFNDTRNHERIVEQFEHDAAARSSEENDTTTLAADPVNIICMDGGGMKGYCHITAWEELAKMLSEQQNENDADLMEFFDLTCGSSVGGVAALVQGHHGTTSGYVQDGKILLDQIRERVFSKFGSPAGIFSLCCKGTMTSGEDSMAHIFLENYRDIPLCNEGGLRSFGLCTVRNEHPSNGPDKKKTTTYDPYILRSYELPGGEPTTTTNRHDNNTEKEEFRVDGTSKILLCEAMAATAAAPVLASRVNLSVEGDIKRVADGCLISNAPAVIAIAEARRLWPKRPIGIILDFGCGTRHDPFLLRAIEAAKKHNPNLHYLRLTPPLDDFAATETDPEKIKKMQELAVQNTRSKSKEIDILFDKLKVSGPRRQAGIIPDKRAGGSSTHPRNSEKKNSTKAPNLFGIEEVSKRLSMLSSVKLATNEELMSATLLDHSK